MTRPCSIAVATLLLGVVPALCRQPTPPDPANVRGDSAQTRKRLAEAEQKVLGGKAAEAIDDLARILDEAGDDLITVDGKQYRPARWIAHQILARVPPDALRTYRDRIDQPAKALLDAGKRDRDPRPLWQLLDRYFVSRPAEEGAMLLAQLLFERGEFRTAELLWRRLLRDAEADVAYPDAKADPAAIRARVVLAVIFQGEPDRAKAELAAFKAKHPAAAGPLAGTTGPFADTLQRVLDHPPQVSPDTGNGREWPTFAGDPQRTGRVPVPLPHYWPGQPTWSQVIPGTGNANRAPPFSPPARKPFGHPVIAHENVYVTDGSRVFAFDLTTGRILPAVRLQDSPPASPPCCTLTVAGDRLYARLGPAVVRSPEPPRGKDAQPKAETAIVCLGMRPDRQPGDPALRKLWELQPPKAEGKAAMVWEGAPLVADRRLWAVLARFEGGRVAHSVACYDPADSADAPDRPAWVTEVSDSPVSPGPEGRTRQELLTRAGRNVVFNSNGGAVVALDAATGRKAWGFRYPRAARRVGEANRSPDPAPPVAFGGRVFVAPADADRVYALDAETGAVVWESGPVEGAEILGVARNRVVVSTTGPVRGIRGLAVASGSHLAPDGWIQSDGGGLLGYGRGVVTDDVIAWPSRAGLFFLDPETGRPLHGPLQNPLSRPLNGLFGHIAYADGVLVVVTPTLVWGYVTEAKRLGGVAPRSGIDPARVRFEARIDEAERLLAEGRTADARQVLLGVVRSDLPERWRAWAAARLVLLTPPVDDRAKLPADVREAIGPPLRDEWVFPPDGLPVTLGQLLARHCGADPGRGVPSSPVPPPDRKPEDAPGLTADAEIDRTLKLPPGSLPLQFLPGAAASPKRFYIQAGAKLLAVPLEAGEKAAFAAADPFTHAAEIVGGFVAAGPSAVAVYGVGRLPVWVFRVPDTDPLPDHPGRFTLRTDDPEPVPHLSSFLLAGPWLLARLGDRHLVTIDLKNQRVAWVLASDGQSRFDTAGWPTAPRFESQFAVVGRLVVVQLSDGRRWMVRVETGRVLDDAGGTFPDLVPEAFGVDTARAPWPHSPAEITPNRIAFADGPGKVRLFDHVTNRRRWTYEATEAGLAGDPPQVRAWGDAVLVAVRRNHGVEIDRIEPFDGRSEWRLPAFLDTDRVDLAAADADPLRVYVTAGRTLHALNLRDGKPAWEADLPDTHGAGGWVVRAGRKVVIVYPEAAIPAEPLAGVWDRVARSFLRAPAGWRLPALGATLYDAWVTRTVPVLLFDPETGQLLRQYDLPARGPAVRAWFEQDVAAVATGDQVIWLK